MGEVSQSGELSAVCGVVAAEAGVKSTTYDAEMTSESSRAESNDHSHLVLTSPQASVDSVAVDLAAGINRRRAHRRRVAQCVVIASLASFVVGIVMTTTSFCFLLYPSGRPNAVIIVFQLFGPLLLGAAGTAWVICAALYYKWKKRIKRRERAARLRNRVKLHALVIDVLKRRPQPGDLLVPSNRQQLIEQLRLLDASKKTHDSPLTKSTSAVLISDSKASFDTICMKKSVSNITCMPDEKNGSNDVAEEKTLTPGSRGHEPPDIVRLPGIVVSNYDPSDQDECDGGSLYYDDEPLKRSESYSAGGTRCTLTVRRGGGGGGSSCSSSAGLFASQRSLPWSSMCSSRLGVGDSGWDGDVSHEGSTSTVSRRDWTEGLSNDAVQRAVMMSASMSLFVPFSLDRRHSMSTAEHKLAKTSPTRFGGQRRSPEQRDDSNATRLSVKSETTDRLQTSDDDDDDVGLSPRQLLHVGRGQLPEVYLGISSSRSLTEVEQALLEVTVDNEDSDTLTAYRPRSMTAPIKRRPLRPRNALSNRCSEKTTIWINRDHRQHTDDSEVERRVERLLYEIDHSVTESVDESQIQSQEFEMPFN